MFPTPYLRFVERVKAPPGAIGPIEKILQVWWTDGLKENNQPYPPNSTFGKWVDVGVDKQ